MDNNSQLSLHHHHLCSGLSMQKTSSQHTDTVIVVDDIKFPCHKAILVAMSAYFSAMYSSGMQETQSDYVKLKGISSEHFKKVLNFMYTGKIDLRSDNMCKILQLSAMYQIEALQQICEKCMAADICMENCIFYWQMAKTHYCLILKKRCFWFITDHFLELSETVDFLQLEKDDFIECINSDCLNVYREEDVFRIVTLWLDYDINRGVEYFYDVCQNLRLPFMNIDLIKDIAKKSHCIKSYECHQNFIQNATKESQNHPIPGVNLNPIAFQSRKEPAFVMVDGRQQEVCCFSVHLKKLFFLAKFPYFSYAKAACIHKGDLYVSGGKNKPCSMVRFITDQNKWESCNDLIVPRYFHAMVSVNDHIYIMGGFSTNSNSIITVERFNPSTGEIMVIGEIGQSVSKMSVVATGNSIYLCGGSQQEYNYLDDELLKRPTSLLEFNTITYKTNFLGHIPTITIESQAITVEDVVYIFSPNGNVLTISDGQAPVIVHVLKSMRHRHFRVVYHQGCFYLLQLAAKDPDGKCVLKWNPQTKNEYLVLWDMLPIALQDSHWMKVVINKQYLRYEAMSAKYKNENRL